MFKRTATGGPFFVFWPLGSERAFVDVLAGRKKILLGLKSPRSSTEEPARETPHVQAGPFRRMIMSGDLKESNHIDNSV